ncbi:MAG: DUF502 domain-containing protein [Deltaproteobacteria bacterium]|nr:DUF502 domain-containing protein [Deltaproteobacteria bacterium]
MARKWLKQHLGAGLLVLIPIVATVWVLKIIILWCEGIFETLVPAAWRSITLFGYPVPGVGLIFTFLLVLFAGVLTRLYFGRKLLALGDRIIQKIPFGRGIYSSVKQLLHALMATERGFRQVVLVEFPKAGSHMIGFVTSERKETLHVFIPTTPNPTSGFLLLVDRDKVKPLEMSVDQAFKLIVSGGTVQS